MTKQHSDRTEAHTTEIIYQMKDGSVGTDERSYHVFDAETIAKDLLDQIGDYVYAFEYKLITWVTYIKPGTTVITMDRIVIQASKLCFINGKVDVLIALRNHGHISQTTYAVLTAIVDRSCKGIAVPVCNYAQLYDRNRHQVVEVEL